MNIKGFIELHDWYAHAPFIVNVNAIESVEDRFIIYAQSGHNVDERYDEILKLMETAQAGEGAVMTNDEALECFESDCETCQFKGRDCKSCRTKVAISALRREIRN